MNELIFGVAVKAIAGLGMATLLFFRPAAAVWLMGCCCFALAIFRLDAACERLRRQGSETDHRPPVNDPPAGCPLCRWDDDTQTQTAGRMAVRGSRSWPPAL